MKKINTLLLLFLVGTLTMFAQENEKTKQTLNNAPFIFKGTVISETPFKGEHDKDFLISYEINVEKIYKGNQLNVGNITLVTKSVLGWSESEGYIIPDVVSEYTPEEKSMFKLGVGASGVFVCKQYTNELVTIPTTKTELKNNIIIEPIWATKYCFFRYTSSAKYKNNQYIPREYIKGFNQYFSRLGTLENITSGRIIWDEEITVWEKLDNYLKEIGITPQKETVKKKDVTFLTRKDHNETIYKQRVKKHQEYKELLDSKISLKKKQVNNKANEDVNFEISNQQITGSVPQFFEFDIMISGNSNNTYLDNSSFFIEYNSFAFGDSISLNNNITITRGSTYNTNTYINPMSVMIDDTPNSIRFYIGSDFNAGSWNRTQVSSFPEELVHIKIVIQNCNNDFANIQFINTATTTNSVLYTLNPTASFFDPLESYNNVSYTQPQNFALCPDPLITNMFPNPISSGTGSVLTIQGFNFGNTRGTGQIHMLNDKGGSSTIEHFDYIDYISWTDTEIKFIVPSNIDTLGFDTTGISVGSGDIAVKRNDGAIGSSTGLTPPLDIHYANTNVSLSRGTPSYKKVPMRVVDITPNDLDTGMVFYLDSSITNVPMREAAVRTALHDWSCATLINWKIKGDTTLQHATEDISVIYMDDNFQGDPLARTFLTNGSACTDSNGDLIIYYKDIDIGITRGFNSILSTSWLIDTSVTQPIATGEQDFYAAAQHEFGHAHGLTHVNDNSDIMYYANPPGPINAANRLDLFNFGSLDAITGGSYLVTKSGLTTTCNGVSAMVPASAQNCSAIIGLDELFNKNIELVAYPNPVNDILNISFKIERNANITISLYDYIGKEIKTINKGKQYIGKQNIEINVSNVVSGFYFLRVQINNRIETVKLIVR